MARKTVSQKKKEKRTSKKNDKRLEKRGFIWPEECIVKIQ